MLMFFDSYSNGVLLSDTRRRVRLSLGPGAGPPHDTHEKSKGLAAVERIDTTPVGSTGYYEADEGGGWARQIGGDNGDCRRGGRSGCSSGKTRAGRGRARLTTGLDVAAAG
jgi:hypothetical protein